MRADREAGGWRAVASSAVASSAVASSATAVASSAVDLVGRVFGRLKVLTRAEDLAGRLAWRCRCACGRKTVVDGRSLRAGRMAATARPVVAAAIAELDGLASPGGGGDR